MFPDLEFYILSLVTIAVKSVHLRQEELEGQNK